MRLNALIDVLCSPDEPLWPVHCFALPGTNKSETGRVMVAKGDLRLADPCQVKFIFMIQFSLMMNTINIRNTACHQQLNVLN